MVVWCDDLTGVVGAHGSASLFGTLLGPRCYYLRGTLSPDVVVLSC